MRLVLSQTGKPASDQAVIEFLRLCLHRRIDLQRMRIGMAGKNLAFAALGIPSPGRTSLLMVPPAWRGRFTPPAVCELIEQVCREQQAEGMGLMQCLLPRGSAVGGLLPACGFEYLAELTYMQRQVRRQPRAAALAIPDGWALSGYSPERHADFLEAVERSYVDSLDCPRLTGRRSLEDILAGHRAAGEFRPEWWKLLCRREGGVERPAGVLLLAGVTSAAGGLELVYLGLAPESRGVGLGDLLMRQAIAAAAQTQAGTLTLAVDSSNRPALDLYRRHGLRRIDRRSTFIRQF